MSLSWRDKDVDLVIKKRHDSVNLRESNFVNGQFIITIFL